MTNPNPHDQHNPFQSIACALVPCADERARMQREASDKHAPINAISAAAGLRAFGDPAPGLRTTTGPDTAAMMPKVGPMAASARGGSFGHVSVPAAPWKPPALEQGDRSDTAPYRFPPLPAPIHAGAQLRIELGATSTPGEIPTGAPIQDAMLRALQAQGNLEALQRCGLVTAQQIADALAAGRIDPNVNVVIPRAMLAQVLG